MNWSKQLYFRTTRPKFSRLNSKLGTNQILRNQDFDLFGPHPQTLLVKKQSILWRNHFTFIGMQKSKEIFLPYYRLPQLSSHWYKLHILIINDDKFASAYLESIHKITAALLKNRSLCKGSVVAFSALFHEHVRTLSWSSNCPWRLSRRKGQS